MPDHSIINYSDAELRDEQTRRKLAREANKCDFCGGSDPNVVCSKPGRHSHVAVLCRCGLTDMGKCVERGFNCFSDQPLRSNHTTSRCVLVSILAGCATQYLIDTWAYGPSDRAGHEAAFAAVGRTGTAEEQTHE